MKLVFIHVYTCVSLCKLIPLIKRIFYRLIIEVSQTIDVFILVIFFYLEPTMVICMFNSMWNSYVWLFIDFIFKHLLKIMITNVKLTVINS